MLAVSLLECGLLLLCERAGGGGDANVGDMLAELELEVSARNCVVLRLDLNTLECYEERLIVYESTILERFCILEYFGVICGSDGSLVGIKNLYCAVFDFMSAAVNILDTADSDGHTDLKLIVGYRVGRHLVGVVSAVIVLEVDAVVRCALRLCDDACDNTLDGYCFVCNFGYVFSPRELFELRNFVVEGKLFCITVCVLYGSLELIYSVFGSVGVDIDFCLHVFFVNDELNIFC